ncbi:MAG: COG2426 family protein [Candidatus Cyclobacteriaceae bacterium M2_1C_046]
MIADIIFTILLSLSPFGEARVGIPYGILNGLNVVVAFLLGLGANLLIYPMIVGLVKAFDKKMWRYSFYKKQTINLSRRAKNIVGDKISKYGFWGLMIFVMIPLPATGAYIGTIAAILFKVPKRKAFSAISLGVIISCIIVTFATYFGHLGVMSF